ncbi:DUF421 domain-containing protein [Phenylobacterium sp.]|jgi:uncharacterized membrane protein YcaP (DUF421 family)|uniref:DUF421 domain-containing protein n=1 Tax=Phenylobacterium sp. TaxID=1871053 RepID=UPI002F4046D1
MDWFRALIGPDEGADTAQLCVRAVLIFFLGVLYIRIAGRRTFSHSSPLDIIVALIVGSNLSRVMTGKADVWPSITATLVLVVLHRLFALLTLRSGFLARIMKADPVVLIRDGAVDRSAARRHGVGQMDLLESARIEQVERLEDVKLATLENSGKISVVPRRRAS